MQQYWTLTRRELGAFFCSVSGYIVLGSATFLLGASFWWIMRQTQGILSEIPAKDLYWQTWYLWLPLLLETPLITMRLFSVEKFSGTFETLMTAPVSDMQVVMAKFSAGLFFYLVAWLPWVGCMVAVRYYTGDASPIDWGIVGTTFLGLGLLGGMFIAAGCCASALTPYQMVAAIISLVFGLTLFFPAYFLAGRIIDETNLSGKALACFGLVDEMQNFARGIVDTRPIVFLVTATVFFLFLTLRIIESRRWR